MCRPDDFPPHTLGDAVEAGIVLPDVDFPVDWPATMPWDEARRRMADARYDR